MSFQKLNINHTKLKKEVLKYHKTRDYLMEFINSNMQYGYETTQDYPNYPFLVVGSEEFYALEGVELTFTYIKFNLLNYLENNLLKILKLELKSENLKINRDSNVILSLIITKMLYNYINSGIKIKQFDLGVVVHEEKDLNKYIDFYTTAFKDNVKKMHNVNLNIKNSVEIPRNLKDIFTHIFKVMLELTKFNSEQHRTLNTLKKIKRIIDRVFEIALNDITAITLFDKIKHFVKIDDDLGKLSHMINVSGYDVYFSLDLPKNFYTDDFAYYGINDNERKVMVQLCKESAGINTKAFVGHINFKPNYITNEKFLYLTFRTDLKHLDQIVFYNSHNNEENFIVKLIYKLPKFVLDLINKNMFEKSLPSGVKSIEVTDKNLEIYLDLCLNINDFKNAIYN